MPKKTAAKKSAVVAKAKRPATSTSGRTATRQVKPPKRKFWRRTPKRYRTAPRLPSARQITKQSAGLLKAHWRLIGGIVLVYGLLNVLLVHGLSTTGDITTLKSYYNQFVGGNWGHFVEGLGIFSVLLASSGSAPSDVASAYQFFLLVLVSLALVWTLRQLMADNHKRLRIRDGFYQGMYPLVPVLLVLLVMALQLIPFAIGAGLYSVVTQNDIAITALEQAGFFVVMLLLAAVSIYMLCSSLFALYIVTLPDMTPLKALRSARGLVRFRRWAILRKFLFLIVVLVVLAAIIMLPVILFLTPVAEWLFYLLTFIGIAVIHAYLYTLYRHLLAE